MGTVPFGTVPIFISGEGGGGIGSIHLYSEGHNYKCLLSGKMPHLTVLPMYMAIQRYGSR